MRAKILVVGDGDAQREALAHFLAGHGCFTETAVDGLEALRKLRPGLFDTIVLDDRLPDIDGAAVATLIADLMQRGERPRTICLTKSPAALLSRQHDAENAFDAVLAKPWQPEALLAAIAPGLSPACHVARDLGNPSIGFSEAPGNESAVVEHDLEGPGRVLVVDDDPIFRDVVRAALDGQGHAVQVAANGLEAVREITKAPYDVVLLDLKMPQIDGLATAKLVHDLLSRAHRPRLIALTGSCDELNAREVGVVSVFDAVIEKSVTLRVVAEAVQQSLDYRRRPIAEEAIKVVDLSNLKALLEPSEPTVDVATARLPDERFAVLDREAFDAVAAVMPRAAIVANFGLLQKKIETLRGHLDGVINHFAAEDLAGEAHRVAGSAGLLGLKRLSDAAACYERAWLSRPADLGSATIRLRGAIEVSLTEIRRMQVGFADA